MPGQEKQKIIAVVGPTAGGKTSLGIELAKSFDGEVLAVDSRTIYRGMDIGTAKPEGKWKNADFVVGGNVSQLFGSRKYLSVEGIPHWGIDLVDPDSDFGAANFKKYAKEVIESIVNRGNLPILVGGTGLWFDVLIDNLKLPDVPPDPEMRAELGEKSVDDLFAEYKELDPDGAEVIDRNNKRRLIRALEVTKKTGRPFSLMQKKGPPNYDALWISLDVDREELFARIDLRVDEMVASGLVDEVRKLRDEFGCEVAAMTGIGYRQICLFFDGYIKLSDAIDLIKRDTRHYAKRQMTWFKRNEKINWVKDAEEAKALSQKFLEKD